MPNLTLEIGDRVADSITTSATPEPTPEESAAILVEFVNEIDSLEMLHELTSGWSDEHKMQVWQRLS